MAEIDSMIRIGIVSAVDADQKTARVFFPDKDNMMSGWLKVLQFPAMTESVSMETEKAGGHNHSIPKHTHTAEISDVGLTTEKAGIHNHSVPEHNHVVDIAKTSLTTSEVADHNHVSCDYLGRRDGRVRGQVYRNAERRRFDHTH